MESSTEQDPQSFSCPHCSQAVEAQMEESPQRVVCPGCGQVFVIPSIDGSTELPEEASDEDAQAEEELRRRHEEELDGLRIRQVALAKRATIRAVSYLLIAGVACAVLIGQLIYLTVRRVLHVGWGPRPVAYLLFAGVCAYGVVFFLRKARQTQLELRAHVLPEPTAPPDFSTLSDGTQQWQNLERMASESGDGLGEGQG
jgi:hypothetical protein